MSNSHLERLVHDAVEGRVSRRTILARAAALGVSIPALSVMVAQAKQATPAASPAAAAERDLSNPLGVDPAAPLDVVIFKGGYGDAYAINVNDNIYAQVYPDAEITYAGIQRLGEQLQPRFVGGEPPDVIDNSGDGNLDTAGLASEGQLADLADLMSAPAWDTPGATFADTLVAGSQETAVFNGQQNGLNYVLSATAMWYSASFMEANGYTYPKTWTEFIELSNEIKGTGIAPFVTTGVYPQYALGFVFNQLLWKHDPQAIIDIDNLVDDAWRSESVAAVLEALALIPENGLLLEGWQGLDHIQSQTEFIQGKAAFLPCGTWLENEMIDTLAEVPDFRLTFAPTPSLDGDQIPFEGILAGGGETFIVPAQGKNVPGGKEWLRMLFSKEGSRFFIDATKSLTVVPGGSEGIDLSPESVGTALSSFQAAVAAAGTNTFQVRYGGWYPSMEEEIKLQMGSFLAGEISADEFVDAAQEAADFTKDDDSITKFTR